LRRRQRDAGADAPKIAQHKFRPSASSFAAAIRRKSEIAAVQRGWRDFRIAQESCEHGIAVLPRN
jgi:hypothetical protein